MLHVGAGLVGFAHQADTCGQGVHRTQRGRACIPARRPAALAPARRTACPARCRECPYPEACARARSARPREIGRAREARRAACAGRSQRRRPPGLGETHESSVFGGASESPYGCNVEPKRRMLYSRAQRAALHERKSASSCRPRAMPLPGRRAFDRAVPPPPSSSSGPRRRQPGRW